MSYRLVGEVAAMDVQCVLNEFFCSRSGARVVMTMSGVYMFVVDSGGSCLACMCVCVYVVDSGGSCLVCMYVCML